MMIKVLEVLVAAILGSLLLTFVSLQIGLRAPIYLHTILGFVIGFTNYWWRKILPWNSSSMVDLDHKVKDNE